MVVNKANVVSRKGISGLHFSACCNMVLSDIKSE